MRSWVPLTIIAAFLLFAVWQVEEHWREKWSLAARIEQRSDDLSAAFLGVMRAQVQLGVFVHREGLVEVLSAFIRSTPPLQGIAVLNEKGDILASATGSGVRMNLTRPIQSGMCTGPNCVTRVYAYPVDGPNDKEGTLRPLVVTKKRMDEILKGVLANALREGSFSPSDLSAELPRQMMTRRLQRLLTKSSDTQRSFAPFALHKVAVIASLKGLRDASFKILAMRSIAILLAFVTALALLRSWGNVQRSATLAVRLVREQEKNRHLEEMRLAAAGLAHETRNPLNVVSGIAQSLHESAKDPDELDERTQAIVQEVARINARLSEFIAYSRPKEPKPTTVDLCALVREIARLLAVDADDGEVTLVSEGEACSILADGGLLRQALFNLAVNALEASPRGGKVTIAFGGKDEGSWIEVSDEGPGVPASSREEIFKPYVTFSPSGTGLGLAVVRQVADAHGWAVRCSEGAKGGTVFRIEGIRTPA